MLNFLFFSGMALFNAILAEKRNKKKFVFLSILFLSILLGFRASSVGTDTHTYLYYIGLINNGIFGTFELGFQTLCRIILFIFHSERAVLVIIALLTNTFMLLRLWTFKDKASFPFMVFVYLCLIFPHAFNIVRQLLAISLVFYGSKFLEKQKTVFFLLFVAISATIHTSALLGIGLFPIYYYAHNRMNNKGLMLTISLIMFSGFGFTIADPTITKYAGHFSEVIIKGHGYFQYSKFVPILAFALVNNTNGFFSSNVNDKTERKYIVWTSFLGALLSLIGIYYDQMGRIGLYYIVFELPLSGIATRNNKYRQCFIMFYVLLSLLYFFYSIYYQGSCGVFPYSFDFSW